VHYFSHGGWVVIRADAFCNMLIMKNERNQLEQQRAERMSRAVKTLDGVFGGYRAPPRPWP
jgi:hypothetical protein